MNKLFKTLAAGFIIISLASCSISGPLFVTDNPTGSKVGKSSYRVIGPFILDGGDASVRSACSDGEITKISTVDQKVESGFFVTRITTVVTGE